MTFTLRPWQEQAAAEYRKVFDKCNSHLGIAPTAFGKTVFMGFLASRMVPVTKHRFIVVAHREALVSQNADKIARAGGGKLKVSIERAEYRHEPGSDVVSCGILTLQNERLARCVEAWREDGRPIFLIIDEAHHATADSYIKLIARLKPERILGLTATPIRADDLTGEKLREIFKGVAFNIPRGPMIDDKWLAAPHHWCVQTTESLELVSVRGGDYSEKELAKTINVGDRNTLIYNSAKEAQEVLRDMGQPVMRGVCFAVNVEHAVELASGFRKLGWQSAAITADTPIPERRSWDERLARGNEPCILVSCGVLTEGWDVEQVNLGLFARPTKSNVLADQMLGRILRYMEDKPRVVAIDFEDAGDRVSIASTFKLPPRWNGLGESLREDEIWFRGQLESASYAARARIWQATCRTEVVKIMSEFAKSDPVLVPGRNWMWWDLGSEFRMMVGYGAIVVVETPLGDFQVYYRHGTQEVPLNRCRRLNDAMTMAEGYVQINYPDQASFLRIKNYDDGRPATPSQIVALGKMNIPHVDGMTVREARLALDCAMSEICRDAERGKVTFGKYRGYPVGQVPTWYLKNFMRPGQKGADWLISSGRPEYYLFQQELAKRGEIEVG